MVGVTNPRRALDRPRLVEKGPGARTHKCLGVPTGGLLPKGFLAEAGLQPDLAAEYGLKETDMAAYPEHTERNVRLADGTD